MIVPDFVRGSIAPTFTAFDASLRLDEAGQRNLLEYMQQAGGIGAFFVRSGMGQMFAYGYADAEAIARIACGHLAGRTPVLVGCNGIWDRNYDRRPDPARFVDECIALGRHALGCGAAGVVYTVPEAIAPGEGDTPAGVTLRFFETVCAAVDGPVFLYQPPKMLPAYVLAPATVAQLAGIGNLVGGKFSQSDAEYLYRIGRAAAGREFGFIAGNETTFYAALTAGARAAIGQGTSLNPWVINAIQTCWEAGDLEGLRAAQDATNRLCDACPNPVFFLKRYAGEHGYPVPPHYRPVGDNPYMEDPRPLSDAQYAAFKHVFEKETAPYRR